MSQQFMRISSSQFRWFIIVTFVLALIVDSMVLLNSDFGFIPPMTLLTVLYWSSKVADRSYFISAFILGVLADALYQTTLGAHAMLYCLILFMMLRNRLQFRTYPEWQQAFIIGIYLFIYQLLNTLFFSPVLEGTHFIAYWSMPAAGILLWPLLAQILDRLAFRHP